MGVLIGISIGYDEKDETNLSIRESYLNAIQKAGGIPLLLPPQLKTSELRELESLLGGILLPGGGDVDPFYFGEEPDPNLKRIDPDRDKFELDLSRWAIEKELPVLGICRGMQVLNIACGGSIYQHLYQMKIKHDQHAPFWYPTHQVKLMGTKNRLKKIVQKDLIRVNSFHHQAIDRLAPGFEVAAVAPDGIVEGIIKVDHPFVVGIQWHPERMYDKYPEQMKIFKEFIKICSETGD